MSNNNDIEKRILPGKIVSEETYIDAVLNIAENLTLELQRRLEKEGRYSGLAKSYMDSMWEAWTDVNGVTDDNLEDIFSRVTYLLKPVIIREYRFLLSKHLSEGDCFITILRKIYLVLGDFTSQMEDFKYKKEIRTIQKLIDKFFENIRNRKKNTKLFNLGDALKFCIENGVIGKYNLDKIDFSGISTNKQAKVVEILSAPGDRLVEDGDVKVSEVVWTER